MLKRHDVLFTRMPEIRSGVLRSNAIKANDGLIPIKEKGPLSDTSKYGGYSGKTAAYFTIVEHTIKNKRERILVSMPIIINQKIKQGHTTFIEYLENVLNLVEPSVLYSPIPFNTVFKRGQSLQYLTGSTGDFYQIIMRNMIEPYFDEFTFEYLCLIYKYFEQLEIRSNRKKMNENEMQSLKEIQVIFSSNEKRRQNENRLRFITLETKLFLRILSLKCQNLFTKNLFGKGAISLLVIKISFIN